MFTGQDVSLLTVPPYLEFMIQSFFIVPKLAETHSQSRQRVSKHLRILTIYYKILPIEYCNLYSLTYTYLSFLHISYD